VFDKHASQWHFYTMRSKTYDYVAWEEEGIWTSHAPSVPGVYGLGPTPKASENDLVEALELMSAYLDEVGEVLPSARKVRTGQLKI